MFNNKNITDVAQADVTNLLKRVKAGAHSIAGFGRVAATSIEIKAERR